jgi:hypothetical protein
MAKFFRRGVSKVVFLGTVPSSLSAPTLAEIAAGVDLSPFISEMNGWQLTNTPIRTPNLADTFTSQIDGEETVADSTLTMNDENGASAFRTALPKGTAGWILLAPYGITATKRCEVWPVKSTGINDQYTVGNEPARTVVSFAITAVPTQTATVTA